MTQNATTLGFPLATFRPEDWMGRRPLTGLALQAVVSGQAASALTQIWPFLDILKIVSSVLITVFKEGLDFCFHIFFSILDVYKYARFVFKCYL